jgi:hypothetical protein
MEGRSAVSDEGIRPLAATVVFNFNTSVNGVPTTLIGSPVLSVYKNSTTESITGITLTVDYDSRTGMNHVVVDTSSDGTFYAADNDFDVVITTGTLGGVSQVGQVVGSFTLTNQSSNLDRTTKAIPRGTVTTGGSTTSIPTSAMTIAGVAATGVVVSQLVGRVVLFDGDTTTAGLRGVASAISASSASNTPTLTVATLPATPASGDLFSIL